MWQWATADTKSKLSKRADKSLGSHERKREEERGGESDEILSLEAMGSDESGSGEVSYVICDM